MISRKLTIGIPAALVVGAGGALIVKGLAEKKLNEFLKKSIYIELADDAPAALKLLASNLNLSVKLQDVYDTATGKKALPKQAQYFKVSVR